MKTILIVTVIVSSIFAVYSTKIDQSNDIRAENSQVYSKCAKQANISSQKIQAILSKPEVTFFDLKIHFLKKIIDNFSFILIIFSFISIEKRTGLERNNILFLFLRSICKF